MACNCADEEMWRMEQYFERQIDQVEERARRLRQALLDAGVEPVQVNRIENGIK